MPIRRLREPRRFSVRPHQASFRRDIGDYFGDQDYDIQRRFM